MTTENMTTKDNRLVDGNEMKNIKDYTIQVYQAQMLDREQLHVGNELKTVLVVRLSEDQKTIYLDGFRKIHEFFNQVYDIELSANVTHKNAVFADFLNVLVYHKDPLTLYEMVAIDMDNNYLMVL